MLFRTIALAAVIAVAASARAEPLPKVELSPVVEGLDAPIFLVAPDDGTGRRFVGDQTGKIIPLTPAGAASQPFLDLSDRLTPLLQAFDERGLWSLAFHPSFAGNGRVFVTYSAQRRDAS
ncbi:MAG: hypothetical protein KTR21_12895, partial [Rhodobacteraceae bacterium]|nr:hypothetical protein [Paracoccaceae bacterium]